MVAALLSSPINIVLNKDMRYVIFVTKSLNNFYQLKQNNENQWHLKDERLFLQIRLKTVSTFRTCKAFAK